MSMFRVNASTLRSQAEQLSTLNESFKTQISNLNDKENALSNMWEGEARNAFHNAFQADKAQFDVFYQGIKNFITTLENDAAEYEKAEAQNLSTAQTRKA
ncbi:WXG100 family type VII secretion target [Oribacterium sp. KHPX15]|uniref:WXG100 family type VII secretion target n=1 Tax=Oribacterium sp. KHPX15 TaxID=1855342 RepID=UPI0008985F9D|nr:WXG100 family type VII secretion target [Oribacterium sp. KHPX15]SDZ96709.1 WXG100 family type VII secretion target [Oribacterium sp. KHPX15]